MSGRFHPRITFPIYVDRARCGRFQLEPFFSNLGYGINVQVILQLIGGTGENRYAYERVCETEGMVDSQIKEDRLWETFSDFFEGFYHNKVNQDVAVPIAALLLNTHFKPMVDKYHLDLSEYVTEIIVEKRHMGFEK